MPIKVTNSGFGISGKAQVSINAQRIRVSFDDGQIVDVLPDDAPKYIKNGYQIVTMSSDNLAITSVRPIHGTFFVRFKKFAAKDGELPMPKPREATSVSTKDGRRFSIPAGLDMTATFEIVKGKFENYLLFYKIPYAFVPDSASDEAIITGFGASKVASFLENVGIDFVHDSIQFSDNVLPALEKLILKKNVLLAVKVEEGWIKALFPVPQEEEEKEVQEVELNENESSEDESDEDKSLHHKEKSESENAEFINALKVLAKNGNIEAQKQIKLLGYEL